MKKVTSAKQPDILSTAVYDTADAFALRAVANGVADETQQKRALNWIIYQACNLHGLSYRPGKPDETSFSEGQRFVALQINALLHSK